MKLHKPRTYLKILKRRFQGPAFLHEPEVMKIFKRIRGGMFIDIGCNVGLYSISLSSRFKEVWAFDPNASAISKLQETAKKQRIRNIVTFNLAVSDRDGEAPFFIDQTIGKCDGSADTLLPEFKYRPASHPEIDRSTWNQESVKVRTARLDDFILPLKIGSWPMKVELVKIDVEGAEFLVLEGMKESLSKRRVKNFMIELHDRNRKEELQVLMKRFDFYSKWIDPDHLFCSLKKMS